MTKITELNNESTTCIGCRLPWNEAAVPGSCRNAVLVIADDSGIQVTEILLPATKHEQRIPKEPSTPAEPATPAGQMIPNEPAIPSGPDIIIGVRV